MFRRLRSPKRREVSARRDLVLAALAVGILFLVGLAFDVYDRSEGLLHRWAHHEHVDELVAILMLLVVASTVPAMRQWRTGSRESRLRRETEQRYRALIEQVPAVIYTWDTSRPAGEVPVPFISPQVEDLLGYPVEGWLRDPTLWPRVIHPDDRDRVLADSDAADRDGRPYVGEYRALHRDGRVVWIHDESRIVAWTDDGRPALAQGVMQDITERKLAEERLGRAEERHRLLIEHLPVAVYTDAADEEVTALYVSPQYERITGYTPDERTDDPGLWRRMLHPQDRDRVIAESDRVNETGEDFDMEYRIVTADGRTVWLHDHGALVAGVDGEPVWQGILYDITERKLAEHALRASEQRERQAVERLRALDEMKNTFLAAVSHELRSPLTSILGLSLTLERTPDLPASERTDLLRRLGTNARKLDRLLKDLLDLDRLGRGIVEPQHRTIDVAELAAGTLRSLEGLAGREVIRELRPAVADVDGPKVERIVENLLANAAKHTTADRRIWLRVEPAGDGVLIAVEDDGPGVPEEIREGIFEPFRQGPTASPHAPGTGIGLSLVARFAELHGGRAWVEPREGGGASFRVFLPSEPRVGDLAGTTEAAPAQA